MANEIVQDVSMKVFVTGATTAAGRAVTRQLSAAGHRVFGTTSGGLEGARAVRSDGGIPAYPNLLSAGELRSAIVASEADVVVNLAPQVANHIEFGEDQWDTHLLTEGTAALVEGSTAAGVKFIIHTSYLFAGGEDEVADSLIDAARTGEQLALGGSVPACVLRFGFIYGAESPELVTLRAKLKLGRPVSSGDPHAHASWIHAADAAAAVVLAAKRQPAGVTLNVMDDHPISATEFLTYFAESQGFSRPSSGSRPNLRTLITGVPALDVSRIHVHADSTETKSLLGWSPRFKDYHQGIDDLLLTWRAMGA